MNIVARMRGIGMGSRGVVLVFGMGVVIKFAELSCVGMMSAALCRAGPTRHDAQRRVGPALVCPTWACTNYLKGGNRKQ